MDPLAILALALIVLLGQLPKQDISGMRSASFRGTRSQY
jgi:hypothetical protein